MFIPLGRQFIIVFRRRQLHGLQVCLCRRPADHKGNVVWRTRCGSQRPHLLNQVVFQLTRSEQRFGFLIKIGLVRGTAALRDAKEFVLIAIDAVEVNLRRQVGAGVHLFIHIQRGVLRIAQVIFDVGVIHPTRQRRFITTTGPDALALFADDNRRAGILAGWQNTLRRDVRVTQELQRHIFVVFTGVRVAQNIGNLLLVCRAQHK